MTEDGRSSSFIFAQTDARARQTYRRKEGRKEGGPGGAQSNFRKLHYPHGKRGRRPEGGKLSSEANFLDVNSASFLEIGKFRFNRKVS